MNVQFMAADNWHYYYNGSCQLIFKAILKITALVTDSTNLSSLDIVCLLFGNTLPLPLSKIYIQIHVMHADCIPIKWRLQGANIISLIILILRFNYSTGVDLTQVVSGIWP